MTKETLAPRDLLEQLVRTDSMDQPEQRVSQDKPEVLDQLVQPE